MNKFKFVIFVIILSFVFFKVLMALPKDQIASSKTIKMPVPIMKQIKEDYPKKISRFQASEIFCLAKNIYFEAAIESTAGKIAVAQVTMNRVRSQNYPDSICKVVYEGKHHSNGFPVRDRCQFSWYCDGKGDEPRPTPAWKDSVEIAEYIIRTPSLLDITDGATHYHADWMEKFPKWAHQKKKLVKIDTHIFYKKRNNFSF